MLYGGTSYGSTTYGGLVPLKQRVRKIISKGITVLLTFFRSTVLRTNRGQAVLQDRSSVVVARTHRGSAVLSTRGDKIVLK